MASRTADRGFIWPATTILLVGAAMRLVALADVPPGLSQDEVLNADIASFIRGGEHALFFRYGFGHEPLYHYLAVPFQALLGDNVLSIRLPAAFLGLLLVAITMSWARRDRGRLTGLLAGAGLALSWWAIIFSRVGIRPMLAAVLLVAAAWVWPRKSWLAGVLLGLSIYSYTATRYIFLLPLGVLIYLALFHRHDQRWGRGQADSYRSIQSALIVLAISLAMYGPLALTLRTDPTLQQRVDQLSGPLDALRAGDLQPVLAMSAATLGAFSFTGDPRWTYSLPGRPVFDPLTSLLFMVGLALVVWRWRRPKNGLLLLWFGLGLLPSALSPDAPSTIRMIGVLPLAYLLAGMGGQWLWQRWQLWAASKGYGRRPADVVAWTALALLLAINVWRTVDDGFVTWPAALETRLKYQSVLQEMGRHWEEAGRPTAVMVDAFFEPIDADSLRRDLGYDPGARWVQAGGSVSGAVVIPGQPGPASLYVPEFAPAPVTLLAAAGIELEPSYRSQGQPSFAVHAFGVAETQPDAAAEVHFEESITFLGHDIIEVTDEVIEVLSYWRVESSLPEDLAAFLHLVDAEGAIVAQHDGLDAAPRTLRPGDLVIQAHRIALTEEAPDGPLALQVGLYERGSQRRLIAAETGSDRIEIVDELSLTKK